MIKLKEAINGSKIENDIYVKDLKSYVFNFYVFAYKDTIYHNNNKRGSNE